MAANEAEKLLSGAFPQRWKLLRRIQDQAGKYTAFRNKEKGDLELKLSMSVAPVNMLWGPQIVDTDVQDLIRGYFSKV